MKDLFYKISKLYKFLAIIFFNIILLLIALHFFAAIFIKYKDKFSSNKNPIVEKYGEDPLGRVYPDLNKEEINKLLSETWNRSYIFESWTGLTERPYSGKYVNVDNNGFRHVKNQGPWPPDKKYINIFIFGGSTTFGYSVPDWQTVPSYLQEYLSKSDFKRELKVYNFGRGYYYSIQERILFEQLIMANFIPDMVIFIDGLNDSGFAYANWIFTDRFKILFEQTLSKHENYYHMRAITNKFPIVKALKLLMEKQKSLDMQMKENVAKNLSNKRYIVESERIIYRYIRNKKIIEAIADSFHIKTLFVWQAVPFYKYSRKYQLFYQPPDPLGEVTYRRMANYINTHFLGNNFLWCADIQEKRQEPLYVDNVHYSAKMSETIASYVCDYIIKNDFLSNIKEDITIENEKKQ